MKNQTPQSTKDELAMLLANVEACERCAAGGGVALPVAALPHPVLARKTAKSVGGRLEPLPMFGQKVRFGESFTHQARKQCA